MSMRRHIGDPVEPAAGTADAIDMAQRKPYAYQLATAFRASGVTLRRPR